MSMSRVHGVLNYAGCLAEAVGSVERVDGWEEAGLRMDWVTFTIFCSFLRSWAEQEPYQAVVQPEKMLSQVHL